MDILQKEYKVLFGDGDISGRMRAFAVFEHFQNMAVRHADLLGVGKMDLIDKGQCWVLSRMQVVMHTRPKVDDDIVLRTWPRGADRLFFVRDYDIRDTQGNLLVSARSGWLILDLNTHRPLRPQALAAVLPSNEGLNAMEGTPLGLSERHGLASTARRRAAYSDIDFNEHMNNARYVQWAEDICDFKTLSGAARLRFDVNYLLETRHGEELDLSSGIIESDDARLPESSAGFAVQGNNISREGQPAFRAEILFG
jgi:acyl-ACP thioesterase